MTSDDSPAVELQELITRLNDAWLGHRFEQLGEFLHPEAVFVTPDFSTRIVGRGACVASYRDFVSTAKVHSFRAAPADVDVIGTVAVALVPYEIDYEMEAGRWHATGWDMLVFRQLANEWIVAWRWMLPGEETPVDPAVVP